ncbi:acyltransferase family protein [Thomasclavelia spiroformis]|uniref:acyltransferase family protein n=1 Tax=Thomasclavelia spiroformis TaxID=29348 RepID=UPI000B3A5276|nr:acyltransferase family protein [Thomasclavelia spiroformis]OUO70300.1 hypothetical protein B5F64_06515 [Thomasclavelia spiroformis]
MSNKIEYPLLDVAKFISALTILLYHYFSEHGPVFWIFENVLSLYAVAVALFMAISGFLTFSKIMQFENKLNGWSVVKKQIKRILTIYLLWSIPYIIFNIINWDWTSGEVNFIFVLSQVREWTFKSTFATIWFMPALALGLFLAYWIYVKFSWKNVLIISIVLYVLGSLQLTYSFILKNNELWSSFCCFSNEWLQGSRGGLFFGVPLIILGAQVARIKWRSFKILLVFSIISLAVLILEAITLKFFIGGCGLDLAFTMLPTCFFILMFLTSINFNSNKCYRWMRSMSILIFMVQRLFLTVIPYFINDELYKIIFGNNYIGCLIVCGSVVVFSNCLILISRKYKHFCHLF